MNTTSTPLSALHRLFVLLFAICATALFGGCADEVPQYQSVFFYEALPSTPREMRETVALPSGTQFTLIKTPALGDENFLNAVAMRVGPADDRRPALLIQLDQYAASRVHQHTLRARGTRMFLGVNGQIVGVHPIMEEIRNGNVFFFVDLPHRTTEELEAKVVQLAKDLRESILVIRNSKE
ncbi:MAG: hypothetical protein LBV54_05455 [Puniceicoccales bacterium]|jgi:hypothetical protein|nr:hypothetical protein [Puniceicoccales bacterium]